MAFIENRLCSVLKSMKTFHDHSTPRPRAALPLTPLISKIALFLIGSKSPPIALFLVIFTIANL